MQHALLVLKHQLEFLHVQFTHQLIFFVFEDIEVLYRNVLSQFLHQIAIQTVHVNGETDDLMNVYSYKT